jgi:hypothetical protein
MVAAQGSMAGVPRATAPAADSNLPRADRGVPFDRYDLIDRGEQTACLYYALAILPVDYEKMAGIVSQEYRSTSDAFRKHELLEALKPRVDATIAGYRQNRYFRVSMRGSLNHYDFSTRSFPLSTGWAGEGSYLYFDNAEYTISFTNGTEFASLPMADEAAARALEARVTKGDVFRTADIYAFAQAADTNANRVKCQIVKIDLLNHGQIEAEMRPQGR